MVHCHIKVPAYGGGLAIYSMELEKMQKQADTLMEVLRKEYHLKE